MLLLPAAAGLLLMVGCSTVDAARPQTAPAVDVPYPEIGVPPALHKYTETELGELRQSKLDQEWADVLATHSNAVRPTVGFVGYIDDYGNSEPIVACLRAQGLDANMTSDGKDWMVLGARDESFDVATYFCDGAFPKRPQPPLTIEQIGYLFDYLTIYRVPCLEYAGFPTDPPPTRKEFIDSWPNVQWYPSTYSGIADPADLAAINKTCPPSPPGL